jgi:hypothetical protein
MPPSTRDQILICYSYKDRKWLDDLQTMLKPLLREHSILLWSDANIKGYSKWKKELKDTLALANVAVLLVSPHFLVSDFIAEHQLGPILGTAEKQGLVILWACVSSCLYDVTEIGGYQAAHDISKPLDQLAPAEQTSVLMDISRKIKAAANRDLQKHTL